MNSPAVVVVSPSEGREKTMTAMTARAMMATQTAAMPATSLEPCWKVTTYSDIFVTKRYSYR